MELYLIGGKARHGKDTLAQFLMEAYKNEGKKVCIAHITNPLYELCKNYFGWDGNVANKPRELLQVLGAEIIKEKLNKPTFLIDRLIEEISILEHFFDIIIVPDIRLKKEIIILKENYPNTKTIYVKRPNFDNGLTKEEKMHLTEIDLDDYIDFDYKVDNTSLEHLKLEAQKIVKEQYKGGSNNE